LSRCSNVPGKRGHKHRDDLRCVVNAMLYIAQTGCQWRYLPASFGPWARVWSQFRRWSRNGTWARALTLLHAAARDADGRTEGTPSMVVIDTHLARGASNGGRPVTSTATTRFAHLGAAAGGPAPSVAPSVVEGSRPAPRPGGPPGRVGRQAADLPPHPARLESRGRPRPPGTLAPPGEVVREHHHLGDRLAPGRLHRHDAAPPVTRTRRRRPAASAA